MARILEFIVNELNPKYDFDNIQFHREATTNLKEAAKASAKNLIFYLYLIKPFVRGSIIGGATGALVSLITGNSPAKGYVTGSIIGACIDFQQFMFRGLYYYMKKQI